MMSGVQVMERIALPRPRQAGEMSVEEALHRRRSVREYGEGTLSLEEIGQLLWAAQGMTDPMGLRTAPSSGALYPLEVFLAVGDVEGVPPGVYHYYPRHHELRPVLSGDRRDAVASAALGQRWVCDNGALLVISAVFSRTTTKYGIHGQRYVHLEAGHAAQNVALQATAMGLATVLVGAFDDRQTATFLGLPPRHEPLCLIPVGRRPVAE